MTQQIEQPGTQQHARIHIDQHPYDSPNPTTGSALYLLGSVAPGLELFREVEGDREDVPVPNDGAAIHFARCSAAAMIFRASSSVTIQALPNVN
jgi:hypothetical protein